jgi:hypothetical protein
VGRPARRPRTPADVLASAQAPARLPAGAVHKETAEQADGCGDHRNDAQHQQEPDTSTAMAQVACAAVTKTGEKPKNAKSGSPTRAEARQPSFPPVVPPP